MKKLIVPLKYDNKKLTKFILDAFPNLSPNMLYKALRQKDIKIDGNRINKDCIIYEGNELQIYIADNLQAMIVLHPLSIPNILTVLFYLCHAIG